MGTQTLRLCSGGQQTKGKKTTESGKQKQVFCKYTVSHRVTNYCLCLNVHACDMITVFLIFSRSSYFNPQ